MHEPAEPTYLRHRIGLDSWNDGRWNMQDTHSIDPKTMIPAIVGTMNNALQLGETF
jgi:hypothetical protein